MDRDVALLCNPSAGGGRARRVLPEVEEALREHGVAFHTEITRGLEHGREVADAAARAGEVVVTLSGDGLVGAVAGVLREHPSSLLGVLPGGRGNDFARALGIPRELPAACAVIATGTPRPIDVGDAGGRTFVGIGSLGIDAEANRIANDAPKWLGATVYLYAALRALASWQPVAFELRLDGGEPLHVRGYSVSACNSPCYGGGMMLAPDAKLDDGHFDVVVIGELSKPRFLATLPKVFRGAHVTHPAVSIRRARELVADADRPLTLYADGDPIGTTPVTIRVVPGAVRVLVPRGATTT
ncbi:MAG TPA: diacylglycerol kinase family protein [Solirubrobacteraceae bacterium]|nr:diacylglycerol kinase family protein [Solirubrobacteraceae bacterium]